MPFQIIQGDITKLKCDAIVNATNCSFQPSGGLDAAVHEAAGKELLAFHQGHGTIKVGTAKLTPAFGLPCKLIIHTVGPHWQGGGAGEEAALRSCYKECLRLAQASKCESVAFPLISSGHYGVPKEISLQAALTEMKQFLFENEMTVYLVLFERSDCPVEELRQRRLHSYVSHRDETFSPRVLCERRIVEDYEVCDMGEGEFLQQQNEGFALTLMRLIDEKGMDDVECYKKANVSRQTWHKIVNDGNYQPNKRTAISFALALELDLEDAQNLLATAGYVLSKSSRFDLIVMYCLLNGIYDVYSVDMYLFRNGEETLASKM